ncbi:RIO1 family regulatory kinase/ATPase [Scopulibacillus cellulosilyticus]|uniref:non-specific serine/threonine protein kinase n=1 Tax=Scopulibacillus cellulosilyticus TaxID=2665665 RepID=A0ABW2Q426_9BACL
MKGFKSIKIEGRDGQQVEVVHNPTSYPLIGKGLQGAVFKLSKDRCVKIYAREKDALKERQALTALQDSPIVPKLYESGSNYIVMEYIEGPTLLEYLKKTRSMTKHLSQQLMFIIREMERIKFTRRDASLRHIIVTKKKDLKLIDLVNSYTKNRNQPKVLLKGLNRLGLLTPFLNQVKKIDLGSFNKWMTDKKLLSQIGVHRKKGE